MRIKDKARLIIGVIDLLVGIACLIVCVYLHRGAKIALTFVPIICGVISLMRSIETYKGDGHVFDQLNEAFGKNGKDFIPYK